MITNDLEKIIDDLNKKDKKKLVFELLDFYKAQATNISDFDILGKLALKSDHRDLYLYCAQATYSMAKTTEHLFNARENLYKAYNVLNYPEKALFYVELNLKENPNDIKLLMNKAFNLSLMNKKDEGNKILRSLKDKIEDEYKNGLNSALSTTLLKQGKTAEGILGFVEAFKENNKLFDEAFKMTKWVGQPISKETKLYINCEGGIGDEFINIRFFKKLKELGFRVIFYVPVNMGRSDLVQIYRRHGYEVITEHYSIDRTGMWAPLLSIPGYLNLTEDQLWDGPYITPLRQEKNKLDSSGKIKIGIKNSGNPFFAQDEYRKINLELMLSYIPDEYEIYFIDTNEVKNSKVINLHSRIQTWEDTLDFIDQMDIIASSCTSLVHAAGAMNKKTIVLIPIACYFIWESTRTDDTSPWYDRKNFTVLKQLKPRQWEEPLEKMRKLLLDNIRDADC